MQAQQKNITAQVSSPSFLTKSVALISKIVDPLIKYSSIFAALVLAAMMFLTFFDVCGRYFFDKPVSGSYEISTFMMGIMVSFALAYTASHKGHIRVDVIMQFAPAKTRTWLDLFAYGLTLIFYILVTWQTVLNVLDNFRNHLTTGVLLIPLYPFVFILVIGAAFVVLVFLRDFLESIKGVTR
jgi:TRAP-type transport system small permease protein